MVKAVTKTCNHLQHDLAVLGQLVNQLMAKG